MTRKQNLSQAALDAELRRRQPEGPIFAEKHGEEIIRRMRRYLGRPVFVRHHWQSKKQAIVQEINFLGRNRILEYTGRVWEDEKDTIFDPDVCAIRHNFKWAGEQKIVRILSGRRGRCLLRPVKKLHAVRMAIGPEPVKYFDLYPVPVMATAPAAGPFKGLAYLEPSEAALKEWAAEQDIGYDGDDEGEGEVEDDDDKDSDDFDDNDGESTVGEEQGGLPEGAWDYTTEDDFE